MILIYFCVVCLYVWYLCTHIHMHERKFMQRCVCCIIYRSGSKWCRWAGEGDHLLDSQTEFEAVQGVADANLSLDLCV